MPGLFDPDTPDGLPQTTRSGIYYEVDPFAYREAWVPGANRTVIECRVDAETAFDWITDMVGEVYVTGTTLRRYLPERNPFDDNQWCTKVEQISQGGLRDDGSDTGTLADEASGWPFVKWARYRCTFEGMPFRMLDDAAADALTVPELSRYVVRAQQTYAREQQLPGGAFYILGSTPPAGKLMQTGFKTRIYGEVSYTRVRIPVANFPAEFKSHRGKINSAAFDTAAQAGPGGYNWSAGELLYVGYDDSNKYFDANEDWVCDVVLNFRFAAHGWNFFYNNVGDPVEVSSDGTGSGTKPYTGATFTDLFTVD